MLRLACLLAAANCLLTAACDPELIRAPDDNDDPPPAAPKARVADCERVGDGVPLAIISGANAFSLATDRTSLFYMAEGRIFALPIVGGAPKPLTPTGFGGRNVQFADGFVYWSHDDTVYRVPSAGGEPEALVELAAQARWAVAGDAILSSGGLLGEPSPLFRSSLTSGETTEIMAQDEHVIRSLLVVGDRVLVKSDQRLLSVSVFGGDEQLLVDAPMSGWDPPVVFDGTVYFGAHVEADHHVARVAIDEPSEPQRVVSGFPVSMAIDDDALYVNAIPVPEAGDESSGALMRVPLDGSPPHRLSATPAIGSIGFSISTAGLVVDEANAYMIDVCTDEKPNVYRLVAIPKLP